MGEGNEFKACLTKLAKQWQGYQKFYYMNITNQDTACVHCFFAMDMLRCEHMSELYCVQYQKAMDTSFTLQINMTLITKK